MVQQDENRKYTPRWLFDIFLIIGLMLMIITSALMFITPLGGIVLGPPIEKDGELVYIATTYISYPDFQMYVIAIAIGSAFLGIGLFGFFFQTRRNILPIAALISFFAAVLNVRCAIFPNWELPESNYTREIVDGLELFLIMTLMVTVIPMFLYSLSFFTKKGKARNQAFIFLIILFSSIVFGGLLVIFLQNLANPQLFVGLDILRLFSMMSLTYIFTLVSHLRVVSRKFGQSIEST